jgi:hypothetical protein
MVHGLTSTSSAGCEGGWCPDLTLQSPHLRSHRRVLLPGSVQRAASEGERRRRIRLYSARLMREERRPDLSCCASARAACRSLICASLAASCSFRKSTWLLSWSTMRPVMLSRCSCCTVHTLGLGRPPSEDSATTGRSPPRHLSDCAWESVLPLKGATRELSASILLARLSSCSRSCTAARMRCSSCSVASCERCNAASCERRVCCMANTVIGGGELLHACMHAHAGLACMMAASAARSD